MASVLHIGKILAGVSCCLFSDGELEMFRVELCKNAKRKTPEPTIPFPGQGGWSRFTLPAGETE